MRGERRDVSSFFAHRDYVFFYGEGVIEFFEIFMMYNKRCCIYIWMEAYKASVPDFRIDNKHCVFCIDHGEE